MPCYGLISGGDMEMELISGQMITSYVTLTYTTLICTRWLLEKEPPNLTHIYSHQIHVWYDIYPHLPLI